MQKKLSQGWAVEYDLLDDKKEYNHEEKVHLLEQLLDSESNLFSTKVRDWLMKQDMVSILIGFITRVAADEENPSPWGDISSDEFVISSNRRRDALLAETPEHKEDEESDSEEEELQFSTEAKRADKAAEVLVYQTSAFPEEFLDRNFETMVCEIFKIFQLNARGDFDNFDKIFEKVFSPRASQLVAVLSKHNKMTLNLLNYLHEGTVAEVLMAIMRLPLPEKLLVNFYNHLNSEGFLQHLGQKLYGSNAESSFEDAAAFFIRLIELCSTFNNADILFADLVRDFSFTDGLMAAITNKSGNTPKEQQIACIYALKALLVKSGEQLFDGSLEAYTPTPLPNMLAGIHDALHAHLRTHVGALCLRVLDEASGKGTQPPETPYSSYTVKKRFTLHRMALLDILVELAEKNPVPVLDNFAQEVWRVLTDWLFDHKFNNVYHALFLKLFKTVLRTNHVDTLRAIFSRYKLLTRLVRHYESSTVQSTGLRGFILLMTNFIRLTSETMPPSEYLNTFLNSNEVWKKFVPILREDTIRQHVTQYSAPSGGSHLSPFSLHDAFGSYGGGSKCKPVNAEDVDIDLGSDYANQLGFWDKVAFTASGSKRKRRRRRGGKGGAQSKDEEGEEGEESETTSGGSGGVTPPPGLTPATNGTAASDTSKQQPQQQPQQQQKQQQEKETEKEEDTKPLSPADIFAAALKRQSDATTTTPASASS